MVMNENEFKKAPFYLQIREAIYNKIINGEYKAGEKLPSEDKLAENFGVSRMTVSKALAELVNKEYLTRVQGSGTFVSKMRKEGTQLDIMGFSGSMTKKGFKVHTQVFIKELEIPSKEIAQKLKIPFTQKVIHLKRLRSVNNEPIVLQDTYLSAQLCMSLMDVDFQIESLYTSLDKVCQQQITGAKDIIEAIAADEETSSILNIKEGFPVLVSQRVAYVNNEVPIELTVSLYRSDQYILEVNYH